jgi:ADP-heptose:LPS heptosyltransferase
MDDYHLGDFVVSLPTVEVLAAYFDNGIDLLVVNPHAGLASLLPSADKIRIISYRQEKKCRTPAQGARFLSLVVRLWRKGYDAVIVIRGGIRDATLAGLTMAPRRVGLLESRRSWVYTDRISAKSPPLHVFDKYGRILKCIGYQGPPPLVRLRGSASSTAKLHDLLRRHVSRESVDIAIIHPGAGYAFRCWPKERFAEAADELVRHWDMDVCLIGGPSERPFLDKVRSYMDRKDRAFLFTEALDVLLALFDRGSVLISNESGPTHLAATTDIPIVTIVGPTNESCWRPLRRENVILLRGPKCSECLWVNCTNDLKCVTEVQVQDVLDAWEGLRNSSNGPK